MWLDGASSKTDASSAFVRESPDAKSVTSWPALDQAVREQRHDPLDPAVAGRRNREPHRAEHGDPHRQGPRSGRPPPRPRPGRPSRTTFQARSKARTPESLERAGPGRQLLRRDRVTRVWRAVVGREAEQDLQEEHRRPGRPGLRAGGGRVGDRERRLGRAGSRRRPPAAGARSTPPPRSSAARSAAPRRQRPPRASPSAISELSWGQTVPLWYSSGLKPASAADIVRTPQPDQSSSPISPSTTASMRSGGTMPLQSRWPMFEVSESTRRLVAVERERVVAAALLAPERLVEALAKLLRLRAPAGRQAPGRARPRAPARPCGASRRTRSPAPRPARSGDSASAPVVKSCESPESFHDWFSSPCGERRWYSTNPSPSSRRAPRSSRGRAARARACAERTPRRPSSARPRRAGRGRAASRRTRSVVAREPRPRGLPAPHLVDDLPGLGVDRGSSSSAWSSASARARCARARARRAASAGT